MSEGRPHLLKSEGSVLLEPNVSVPAGLDMNLVLEPSLCEATKTSCDNIIVCTD